MTIDSDAVVGERSEQLHRMFGLSEDLECNQWIDPPRLPGEPSCITEFEGQTSDEHYPKALEMNIKFC